MLKAVGPIFLSGVYGNNGGGRTRLLNLNFTTDDSTVEANKNKPKFK